MSSTHPGQAPCGCCEHAERAARFNRPGLTEIRYRLGTHSSLLREMRDRISLETIESGPHAASRPLALLGTRELEDPAMALLDSAAVLLDVLTFYQERIANDGFLRTSTERLSVLELARAIGYELSPGVAADVTLVFTLDDTPGKAPSHSDIAAGTKVQSLPANGDLPQTFETVDHFTAYKAWNAMPPRASYEQVVRVAIGGGIERLDPDGTVVSTNQIVLKGTALLVDPGELLVVHLDGGTTLLRVTAVDEELEAGVTRLNVQEPAGAESEDPNPTSPTPPFEVTGTGPMPMTDAAIGDVLATEYDESDLQKLLEERGWDEAEFLEAVNPADAESGDEPTPPPFEGVFVLRERLGLFGHNAQPYGSLPISQREGEWHDVEDTSTVPSSVESVFFDGLYPNSWEGNTVWENSQGNDYSDADLYLEREVDDVLGEGWIALEGEAGGLQTLRAYRIDGRQTASLADYGLSSQTSGLIVSDPSLGGPTKTAFELRKSKAHVVSEWLELADLAIATPIKGPSIELDRMVLGLTKGQQVVITGEITDPGGVVGTEVATISAITHQYARTTVTFKADLGHEYITEKVIVHGNVVRATHGETTDRPLGNGDGAVANQSLDLSRSPLTYVSAATVTGSESTLELRVNGRLWDEVRSLYGTEPADQVYTVRISDSGRATVTFGDGVSGTRPPTGSENISARYRSGTGPDGEVDAETIQLLMTRPPGVKSVNNPLPASGAEAHETLSVAKENAPMTVRTLDRVVSLTDFEDFAATFAGIGKARADVLRLHATRLVHITVGSSLGGQVTDDKIELLLSAMNQVRDPGESVCVSSYQPLSFDLYGSVKTDPMLVHEAVMDVVAAALESAFSFQARRFAQGASVAEVMRVIHGVEGVIAADIDKLEVKGGAATTIVVPPLGIMLARAARLVAGATALSCGSIEAAELLLINPSGIELSVMP